MANPIACAKFVVRTGKELHLASAVRRQILPYDNACASMCAISGHGIAAPPAKTANAPESWTALRMSHDSNGREFGGRALVLVLAMQKKTAAVSRGGS